MKISLKLVTVAAILTFVSCAKKEKENTPVYESRDYNIYMGGKLAGYQKSSRDSDGTYRYIYEFNDRGRGPHTEEKVLVNENHIIVHHEINGHNYLKDTVNEVFKVENGLASWKSSSEHGEVKFDDRSFFSAINSSFGTTDILIKKLLSEADNEVDLLPGGNIKITAIDHHTINDSIQLRLVELTGQSFTPSYTWIDEKDRFFGYTSSWLTCIQKGYDSIAKQLLPIQKQKEEQYLKKISSTLTQTPTKKILINNVTLFNSENGNLIPNVFVVLNDNVIEAVTKTSPSDANEYEVIDGTGKTLLPGLFDMHTHIDESDGILQLAAGVTSVRDLGNSFDLPQLKENFDTNKLIGPRILVMSGFIDKAGPYAGPTGAIINNLEEGFKAIEDYHSKGYKQIKLYSSIEPKWVKPLADKSHELGMRVSGHIPSFMIAEQAVKDGYNEIQHANMLALNFLSDTIDTRTPLRFSMVAEHNYKLDFESEEFKNFIQLLKDKNIVIDPTVSIFEGMFVSKAGDPNPSFKKILSRLPLNIQRGYYSGGLPIPEGKEEEYKASYNKLLGLVKQLYDNGVSIVAGTDALAGFGLHTEMENYVKAGIPASEVLKITTSISAKVCGFEEKLGVVKEGYLADLILVNGNPVENISDIRKVELTIKDGKLYYPKKLYSVIGVKYFE